MRQSLAKQFATNRIKCPPKGGGRDAAWVDGGLPLCARDVRVSSRLRAGKSHWGQGWALADNKKTGGETKMKRNNKRRKETTEMNFMGGGLAQ